MKKQFLMSLVLAGVPSKHFAFVRAGHRGFLEVNLFPDGALAAGAQWSVDGPLPLRDSGTYTVVAVGTHTIYFKTVSG